MTFCIRTDLRFAQVFVFIAFQEHCIINLCRLVHKRKKCFSFINYNLCGGCYLVEQVVGLAFEGNLCIALAGLVLFLK